MNFDYNFNVPKYYNFFNDEEKRSSYQLSETDLNDRWFTEYHEEIQPLTPFSKHKNKSEDDDEDFYYGPIKRRQRLPPMFQGLTNSASAHSIMKRLNQPPNTPERNTQNKRSRLKSGQNTKNIFWTKQQIQLQQKISLDLVTHDQNLEQFHKQINKDLHLEKNYQQDQNTKNMNILYQKEPNVENLQPTDNQQKNQSEKRWQSRTQIKKQNVKSKNLRKACSLKSKSLDSKSVAVSRRLFIANDRKPCPYPPRIQRQWQAKNKKEWYSLSPKSKETAELSMGKTNLKKSQTKQNNSSFKH